MQGRRSEFQSAGARGMELPKLKAKKRNFAKLLQKLGGGGGLHCKIFRLAAGLFSKKLWIWPMCLCTRLEVVWININRVMGQRTWKIFYHVIQ